MKLFLTCVKLSNFGISGIWSNSNQIICSSLPDLTPILDIFHLCHHNQRKEITDHKKIVNYH